MKTTIEIDDELLAAAKRRAAAAGVSVDAFVEEAVREKVVEDREGTEQRASTEEINKALARFREATKKIDAMNREENRTPRDTPTVYTREDYYRGEAEKVLRDIEDAYERHRRRLEGGQS